MKTRTKAIVGIIAVCVLLLAQQPVAQGPQASNAAAWSVIGSGTAGSPGTAVLTVQGISGGTAVPISGSVGLTGTLPAFGSTPSVNQGTSPWIVAGGGTAGSPGTAVLTVQGVGSGTAMPISGTVSLSANSQANAVPQATSTFAATAFDLAATAATQVKATAGNVWGWYGYNPNTSTCFLQFYNSASATLGTNALHPFGILAGGSFNIAPGSIALFNLTTGISTGETTTATGATPCTSAMVVTIQYQ